MLNLRNSKSFQSFSVLIFVLFLIVPAQAQYSGGTGEPNNPYQIATAEDLIALGNEPNDYGKHFIMTADIDLAGYVFDKAVIAPDVNASNYYFDGPPFSGVFDGNFHTISNLNIKGSDYAGLFGIINKGEIRNLGIIDVSILSCNLGGAFANANKGIILNCYSTGSIEGYSHVGGMVGSNDSSGSIISCHSICNVTGTSARTSVGGLAGYNGGQISDSYSKGNILGANSAGGLVGNNSIGLINRCYSTGLISTHYKFAGGLVGTCYDGNDVINSFWDIETSGKTTSAGGIGLTTTQMQDVNNYLNAGWDFVGEQSNGTCNFWYILEGEYPQPAVFSGFVPFEPQGSGTTDDPYLIYDANDLGTVWYRPEKHYRLEADIDLSEIIWNTSVAPWFNGRFDGNSHIIQSLHIEGADYLGLFSKLGSNTEILNLTLESVEVNGIGDYVGGLVGKNDGSITSSCSTGTVSGNDYISGLVGYNEGSIASSYSTGTVKGNDYISGLVGYNDGSIASSCSTGAVNGCDFVGGLVGRNEGSIMSSYSTGTVSGERYVGGLVGISIHGINSSSFWDIENSGQSTSNGGTGLITDEMQMESTFTQAGWDFAGETDNGSEDIWTICEGTNYPRFVWQISEGDLVCPDGIAMEDFDFFMDHWGDTNCDSNNNYCEGTDLDFSGTVDINDFEILINNWLGENP